MAPRKRKAPCIDVGSLSSGAAPADMPSAIPMVVTAADVKEADEVSKADKPVELVLVPYDLGRLQISANQHGKLCVTDFLTCEVQELPPCIKDPMLEIDDETGRAVILSSSDADQHVVMDHFMRKLLFADPSDGHKQILVDERAGGSKHFDFDVYRCRYRGGTLETTAPTLDAPLSMEAYIFAHARAAGCHVYWSFHCMYTLMGLKQYKGESGKWFYNSFSAWERLLMPGLGAGHIIHSTQSHQDVPWHMRCLPSPSISSVGWVRLMSALIWNSSRAGGFASDAYRSSAIDLMRSMLAWMVGLRGSFGIELRFDASWKQAWPQPLGPWTGKTVVLQLGRDLTLSVSPWSALVDAEPTGYHFKLWKQLQLARFTDCKVPYFDMMRSLCEGVGCLAMISQLSWSIGKAIEETVLALAISKDSRRGVNPWKWTGADVAMLHSYDVSRYCATYTESCKYGRGPEAARNLSIVSDKGDLSLPYMFACVTFPDNVAHFCVPQAGRRRKTYVKPHVFEVW